MAKPISLQMYSLREECQVDHIGTLKKVAAIGFKAVEPAGFWGLSPKEYKKMVNDLGMAISSSHSPWCNEASAVAEAIDVAGELELKYVVCGFGRSDFADLDAIKRTADKVNEVIALLAKHNIGLFQHNHDGEFIRLPDGRLAYDAYLEFCPQVKLELDTYWAANFGVEDPVEMVKRFADREILLHIKDGSLKKGEPNLAVGAGVMDIAGVINAAPEQVEYLVVELDNCGSSMIEAVEQSYKYLIENNLAAGNK